MSDCKNCNDQGLDPVSGWPCPHRPCWAGEIARRGWKAALEMAAAKADLVDANRAAEAKARIDAGLGGDSFTEYLRGQSIGTAYAARDIRKLMEET